MSKEWLKISVDIFDDEKIKLILAMPEGDKIFQVWLRLLVMARKTNDSGLIYIHRNFKLDTETLHNLWKEIPLVVIRMAMSVFEQLEMITINDNGIIAICNWEKHQSVDALEKVRELTRKRVTKYRDKQKQLALCESNVIRNVTVTQNVTLRNANVTQQNKEVRSKNIELNIYSEFIEKFNSITNSKYRGCKRSKAHFLARLKEGYTLEQIEQATKNCAAHPYFIQNPGYLTPEFIARDNKLQQYLNYKPKRDIQNGNNIHKGWDGYNAAEEARRLAEE